MRFVAPLLAALTFTACWDLPPGDVTSVYYWGDAMLQKYADELVVGQLEPGPTPLAHPRTVLLITGVTIREEWFGPIVARLRRDGFEPVVYEPPALLSGDLFQASEDLADVVERVRADSGQDKIDILAECTGGVIARYYIQSLGGDRSVARMVTFVSPQHGVGKAPLAAAIAGWPALYDLSPGSDFLTAVNARNPPASVPFTSIYTCTDEWIQPYESSIIPGATNIGLSCDGGFTGHFQTFYDPAIYDIMHDALVAPIPGAPADDDTVDPGSDDGSTDVATDPGDGSTDVATDPDDGSTDADADPIVTPEPTTDGPGDQPAAAPGSSPGVSPSSEDPQQLDGQREPEPIGGLGCAGGDASGLGIALAAILLILVWRGRAELTATRGHANDRAA